MNHGRTVLALVLVAAMGCASTGHRDDDGQLERSVRSRITSAMATHDYVAEVRVNHGVVVLSGTVRSEEERRTIGDTANQVKGVKTVINNIVVDHRT